MVSGMWLSWQQCCPPASPLAIDSDHTNQMLSKVHSVLLACVCVRRHGTCILSSSQDGAVLLTSGWLDHSDYYNFRIKY